MQDKTYNFYLEYSIGEHPADNNHYPNYLHLSFPTMEEAQSLFRIMENDLQLPVAINQNRITIKPLTEFGNGIFFQSSASIHIRFSSHDQVKRFWQIANSAFEKEWNEYQINKKTNPDIYTQCPGIGRKGNYFFFYQVLNPNRVLDKRTTAVQLLQKMLALYKIFSDLNAKDTAMYCLSNYLQLWIEPENFSRSWFNRFFKLDREYALHKQSVPPVREKIPVTVSMEYTFTLVALHLSCLSPEKAEALSSALMNVIDHQRFSDTITIDGSAFYGVFEDSADPATLFIQLTSTSKADEFLRLIRFENKVLKYVNRAVESIDKPESLAGLIMNPSCIAFDKKALLEFQPERDKYQTPSILNHPAR